MKKFIILFLISFLFFCSTFAYDLTEKDKSSLDLINQKFEKIISEKGESYRSIFTDKLKNYSDKSTNEKLKAYVDYLVKGLGKGKISEATKKDLGNGFFLIQTEDKTDLVYDGNVIYTWEHKVSDENPFIDDEGCDELEKSYKEQKENINNELNILRSSKLEYSKNIPKIEELMNKKENISRDEIWYSLPVNKRNNCIKESLSEKIIKVNKTQVSNLFELYFEEESSYSYIINTKYSELYDRKFPHIIKIITGKNGIYILSSSGLSGNGGLFYINNDGNLITLLENYFNNELEPSNLNIDILDFELLKDQKIKVIYNGQNLKKMEKILDLKNFN